MVGENTKTELVKQYILVTPVKNEEKFLPGLIQSIVTQTIKPVLWVIVDDRSIDQTPDIIKKTKEKYIWIQSLQLEEGIRDRGVHLAKVIKAGFDFAYKYCEKNGINFDYLGNVDADVVFENTYFEKLIEKFEKDAKLGVASGGLWIIQNGKENQLEIIYPDGGDVLYKRTCFENCGGVPLFGLWDSALNAKAKMKGWEIKRFDDCKAIITRNYCQADNLWKQYIKIGENYYIMNYNLFHTLLKGVKLCFKKPYYTGLSFLYGYLFSLMIRKKQIPDEEVKKYFWHIHPQETKRYYIDHEFKNKILKNRLIIKIYHIFKKKYKKDHRFPKAKISKRSWISSGNITIGDNTYAGQVNISCDSDSNIVRIGKYCSIASNVFILSGGEHNLSLISSYPFKKYLLNFDLDDNTSSKGPIVIENDVWIGMNVIILSGVTIRNGAVIGAGSIVTKDVPPYAIVAGNPIKIIKYRFNDDIIKKLLKIQWWNWPEKKIIENVDFFYTDVESFIEKFYTD